MFIVASLVIMIIHCWFWFEEKICCEGLLRVGMKSFETFFYLDENAKMDGRISYTVFYMSIFPFVKYLW